MSACRSKQTRELRRRLTVRLLATWALYTVAFAALALALNATVVRGLADAVANATAPWEYWSFEDYDLDYCLRVLGCEIADAQVDEEAAARIDEERAAQAEAAASEGEGAVAVAVAGDADGARAAAAERADEDYVDAMVFLVASLDGASRSWMTADDIKRAALRTEASMAFGAGDGVVIEEGPGFVAGRNLQVYYLLRALKVPIALALYLIGCVAIALGSLRRALRAFDDLAGAVGDVVSDRTRPIELPSGLAITQDELNALRLSSLADERAAAAAERRKDELVAYLAHDIKTPLTSVVGYLELLDEAPDLPEETRRRYIRLAFEKAERFGALIDEFFEITRYNLQSIPLERESVDARLFLEQVADGLYPAAEARGVAMAVDAPSGEALLVDPGKMARAVGNVLRNAVAYADEGSRIDVAARLEPADAQAAEGPAQWAIEVSNQGREISEAHLQSIFDKFYREDGARGTNKGGAGLGLAIAREIVTAHGGTIAAASTGGRTTFTIHVPAAFAESAASASAPGEATRPPAEEA